MDHWRDLGVDGEFYIKMGESETWCQGADWIHLARCSNRWHINVPYLGVESVRRRRPPIGWLCLV